MKPDDAHGNLPPEHRPFRVLIVAASSRRQYNCPGVDSKSRTLMLRMAARLPQAWEIDYEDLGNIYGRARIQSCNGCVSTAMALCCWPCNCYQKNSRVEPDLMWDLDLYSRLDLADAWAFIGPIHWYAPTSNLKLMFDRLVCMSGGNPREDLIGHKDPERAVQFEQSPLWPQLRQNHLEGRTAAFFCYGDRGADEIDGDGRPRQLLHEQWFDPAAEPHADERQAYAPLVWQCRYSGIEVPDHLWRGAVTGAGRAYRDDQAEHLQPAFLAAFDDWTDRFGAFVEHKGKVQPGCWRAFGRRQPRHLWHDLRLLWRDLRMRLRLPRRHSSPAAQQRLGLNRDTGLRATRSEGDKLRR